MTFLRKRASWIAKCSCQLLIFDSLGRFSHVDHEQWTDMHDREFMITLCGQCHVSLIPIGFYSLFCQPLVIFNKKRHFNPKYRVIFGVLQTRKTAALAILITNSDDYLQLCSVALGCWSKTPESRYMYRTPDTNTSINPSINYVTLKSGK